MDRPGQARSPLCRYPIARTVIALGVKCCHNRVNLRRPIMSNVLVIDVSVDVEGRVCPLCARIDMGDFLWMRNAVG